MIGVGFALAGTLIEDLGLSEHAFACLLEQFVDGSKAGELADASCARYRELFDDGMPVQAAAKTALSEVLQSAVLPADIGFSFQKAQRRAVTSKIRAFPDVPDVFNTLREFAIPTAVLTNGWYGLEAAKAAHISFEGPVVTPPHAHWLPSVDAYVALARALSLPVGRVWYVSASERDVQGAKNAGMNGILVDRAVSPLSSIFEEIAPAYTQSALALRQLLISKY